VTDLGRSKVFYRDILGLTEISRPPSDTPGAWYRIGDRELHLVAGNHAPFREGNAVDDQDIHFALRVASYRETRRFLLSKGFHPKADDEFRRMKESPGGAGGWPRIQIMDPDRDVVELSAERLDEG
jgi:catechol 2,3-dioxygenase-like lactoylglutathione lyase family enzyme